MKYRIIRRAHGWAVQSNGPATVYDKSTVSSWYGWHTLRTWRWHWLAALHLLWLRERART